MKQERTKRSASRRVHNTRALKKQDDRSVSKNSEAGKENREHKDSVFVDLFYEDETAERNLLSLYNALHGTDYQDEALVRKVGISDVLYKNFKNDISFEVDGKVLVFGEHQSTVNPNMPLRSLMYAGRAYERLVDKRARYKSGQVKIPAPEFYTFYNGLDDFPLEKELILSDAFLTTAGENTVELKVRVININSDKAHEILDKCRILKEYSLFIDTIRKYSGKKAPVKMAVYECIARGILAEYLKRKGSEVANMLIAEYDYEEDIQVKQEEAREEGERRGIKIGKRWGMKIGKRWGVKIGEKRGVKIGEKRGILLSGEIFQAIRKNPLFTDAKIAKDVGCTIEDVENVRKLFTM